jgi:hypothetical protein
MKTKLQKVSTLKKVTSYQTIWLEEDIHIVVGPFINNKGETIAVKCNCKVDNFHPVVNHNKICCDVDLSLKVMSDPYMMELRPGNMTAFLEED